MKDTSKNNNKYYVYEWFIQDNNHVFYVGKGSGDRIHRISKSHRNEYFLRTIKKHKCDCRIVKNNLSEHEAYVLENELYQKYKLNGECECNLADTSSCCGGASLKGELNGMYGKTHTETVKNFLSKLNKDGRHKGKNNTQYNVSPKERMSSSKYAEWAKKQRERKIGKGNPNAHCVLMCNVQTKQYHQFNTITDCVNYIINNCSDLYERYNSFEKIRYIIKHSNKTKAIYNNWMFVIYNHKKPINIDNTVSSLKGRAIRKIPQYSRPSKKM